MAVHSRDIWGLVWGRPHVDPNDLAKAVERAAAGGPADYRTRLLIRDSVQALREHWGEDWLVAWLGKSPSKSFIETIQQESFERPGFPALRERLMEKTDPETIRQYLRELGIQLRDQVRIDVGGSASLILRGMLARKTGDVDVVDEVPVAIRSQHKLLAQLKRTYGLEMAHFQSHYLPSRWDQRTSYENEYGRIRVYLVDAIDVFLSKLFSIRAKDREDLREVSPQIDKDTLVRRFLETTESTLASPESRQRAVDNWYILFGEQLPS